MHESPYTTVIPDVIFELGLSSEAVALYLSYKCAANGMGFTQSMTEYEVYHAVKALEAPREELGGKSLIVVNHSGEVPVVEITPIWQECIAYFKRKAVTK